MEDEPKAQEDRKLLLSLQIRQRKWDWLLGDRQSACRCPFSFATTAPAVMRLDGQMPVSSQLGWRTGLLPKHAAKERASERARWWKGKWLPKLYRLDRASAGNFISWKAQDGATDEKPVHQQEWCACVRAYMRELETSSALQSALSTPQGISCQNSLFKFTEETHKGLCYIFLQGGS